MVACSSRGAARDAVVRGDSQTLVVHYSSESKIYEAVGKKSSSRASGGPSSWTHPGSTDTWQTSCELGHGGWRIGVRGRGEGAPSPMLCLCLKRVHRGRARVLMDRARRPTQLSTTGAE